MKSDYLWKATLLYYFGAYVLYRGVKSRYRLTLMHSLPFLAIPPTLDYIKREYYASFFKNEQKALKQSRKVVD